ncbi:1-acyl-sn-glycerol-3-phosphate acyltransferase [Natronincola peptidivorans]|uniref:1-acyl-sn-glycerol-3-phosphate acyltransferase n=1 Tax=Natronincola peptidivorans TaxID=426128 RepID=A0A1I0GS02_9FIRM|nr:lysophospholipid acyltransferase family protein [Natronincola peptidivorans]SET74063.1 1-acyl-sn-glycerol-3-phosphate acyltransferase [Natronincola peptidivorans]
MKKVFGIIHFLFYGIFVALVAIPKSNRLQKAGAIDEKRSYADMISKRWSKILIEATGSTVEVIGLDNIPKEGPVLFVSNHQGYFDIPILLHHLPKSLGFLAKIEIAKWPVISKWLACIEGVFIDRNDIRQSLKAIKETTESLKSGQSIVIFPEGTRSKSSELNPFKPGSLKPAQKANVPIVPITIRNTYKILEANNDRNIKPAAIKVIISPAIDSNTISNESSGDLITKVFQTIKHNLS